MRITEREPKKEFQYHGQQSFDPAAGEADLFPQEITRALLNLISNGVYATRDKNLPEGEIYKPTLMASTKSLGDRVEIRMPSTMGSGHSSGGRGKNV